LAGYCYRIAKITGWGYREIMEELPFGAGLQMIFCDDAAHGAGAGGRATARP
jgi:hypothetical protein